jgi:hypothetical protein
LRKRGEDTSADGGDEYERIKNELNITTTSIWTTLSIPVCWENPAAATATRRDWVKTQITNTWQTSSQVVFTGWGTCAPTSTGLRIRIDNTQPATTGAYLGRQLNGRIDGIRLNLNMTAPPEYAQCAATFGAEACVRATATHEFGHALGFSHEQMRLDNPDFDCLDLIGGSLGDTYVGNYDKSSIMRSCTVRDSGRTTLSTTDKLGLQAYYGHPSPSAIRKDAIGWDGEYYYFFFGNKVSVFSVSADKTGNYSPTAISTHFGAWPLTSPWTTGTDAIADFSSTKLYFFSGSQYLRLNKATRIVDTGYPKALPGGWVNWPSTWSSVDAAIKWTNGKLYMFRGSEYIRLTGTTVDAGYPKPIQGNWAIPYTTGFDYGFVYPNGKAYFFKGADYVRVTTNPEATDPGYPLKIVGRWLGVTF